MNMKDHILTALREQFQRWQQVLSGMSADEITALPVLGEWSTQDVIAHLWGWQQISIAQMQAAHEDRAPIFPEWVAELHAGWEENADQTNAWIYRTYHQRPWPEIHQNWREGFLRLLELGNEIPEKDLLDSSRYQWLEGYSLALILIASYDHHQEHLEKLLARLEEHRNMMRAG